MPALSSVLYHPRELSDRARAIVASLLPPAKLDGHPRTVDPRLILNGIFHQLHSGGQMHSRTRGACM